MSIFSENAMDIAYLQHLLLLGCSTPTYDTVFTFNKLIKILRIIVFIK